MTVDPSGFNFIDLETDGGGENRPPFRHRRGAVLFALGALVMALFVSFFAAPMLAPRVASTRTPTASRTATPRPTPRPSQTQAAAQPPDCGGRLVYGDVVSDQIHAAAGECVYRFSGSAGDVVTIQVNGRMVSMPGGGQLDTYVELRGPGRAKLDEDDDGGDGTNSLIKGYTLPADGAYSIVVSAFNRGGPGPFDVILSKAWTSPDCGGAAGYDELLRNQVAYAGAECRYTLADSSNAVSMGVFRLGGDLTPTLTLLAPDGSAYPAQAQSSNGIAILRNLRLGSEMYTAVIGGSGGSTGAFAFSVWRPNACGGILPRSLDFLAELSSGTCDYYPLEYNSVAPANVKIESLTPGFRPAFQVFAGGRRKLTDVIETEGVVTEMRNAALVRITSLAGRGLFRLTFHPLPTVAMPGCGGTIEPGEFVEDESFATAPECEFHYQGTAGQSVIIRMTRADQPTPAPGKERLDPWIDLKDAAGIVICYDDDAGGDRNSLVDDCTLPADGRYTIVARSWQNRTQGRYFLSFWAH